MESEHRLMSLINSVRVLNSTRDLSAVLEQLIREVLHVIGGANASVLFLFDEQREVLYAKTAIGFDMEYMGEVELKPGEGMSGKTFLSKKGRIFSSLEDTSSGMKDISTETQQLYASSLGRLKYPVSAICVPLISNDESIGVLTVDIFEENRQFNDEDLQLLETFATQGAIAIENATLFSQNERTKRIHEALSSVSLSRGGLADITKSLAHLIEKPVIVFNEFKEALSVAGNHASFLAEELEHHKHELIHQYMNDRKSGSEPVNLSNKEQMVYFFPIYTEERIFGLVCIITDEIKKLDPLDRFAIEQAMMIFALEIDRQERLVAEDYSYSGSILERLIHDPYDGLSSMNLANMNFPDLPQHHYVVVQLYIKNPLLTMEQLSGKKQQVLRMIYREVSKLPYRTLVYDRNLEITLMFTVSTGRNEGQLYSKMEEIFTRLMDTVYKEIDLNCLVGIGQIVKNLTDVRLSYEDAKKCVQFLQSTYHHQKILNYQQLGPYRIFLKADREELRDYTREIVGPLQDYDENHRTELLKTLKIYLDSNQSLKDSAAALFVHTNTVKYRLKIINELLNIEKLSGKKAFECQLGLYILDYLSE